ncbi:methylcobamide--CoM methyltransferase [Planctomycetales bacterium]|nr:methylcobamide--CoM methyltransferase [Planctomycetales bacterium]
MLSPKERLHNVLTGNAVDRAPVICPGGMMNAAIVDVMNKTGNTLPNAHYTAEAMSDLAYDVYQNTGFENFGIPFCMTVEAEALGSTINFGSLKCEPKIETERFASVKDVAFLADGSIEKTSRGEAVIQSVYSLSRKHSDIPAVACLTGPISTAASLVDPMVFLKQLRREKETAHQVIDYVTRQLISYAKQLADNGAAVIAIADPTATGEILGPKMFEEYAVEYLNKLADAVLSLNIPVIIHICGDVRMIKPQLQQLHSNVLSTDAMVNLKALKNELENVRTMGNISTYLLEFGNTEKVLQHTQQLLTYNIDILAPACGLSTSTPLENINAFTAAAKER